MWRRRAGDLEDCACVFADPPRAKRCIRRCSREEAAPRRRWAKRSESAWGSVWSRITVFPWDRPAAQANTGPNRRRRRPRTLRVNPQTYTSMCTRTTTVSVSTCSTRNAMLICVRLLRSYFGSFFSNDRGVSLSKRILRVRVT